MVRKKAVPDIPLPPAGDMTPAQHAQISRRFLEHFHIEKRKGNRLQASEKIWGAVSHAISAVAAERGLKHGNYFEKQNVARQIGVELAEAATSSQVPVEKRDSLVDNFLLPYERAENLHRNFHENKRTWPDIDGGQVLAAKFVEELDNYREKGYSEFTPRNEYDSQRWAMLNGHSSKKRDALARYPLERTINLDWRRPDGDDDGSGGGVPAGTESLQERSTVQLAYVCNVDPQIKHTSFDCNW